MDTNVAACVSRLAETCGAADDTAVRKGVEELKTVIALAPPGKSIGPKLAFGALAPAGDMVGRAMLEAGPERAHRCLQILAADETPEIRCIACRALGHVGTRFLPEVVSLASRLAADPSWEVREFIANALDEVTCQMQGEAVYALMEQWVNDPDPNVRRAPTNALMRYGRLHPERVIALMGRLVHDDSRYVRDNVVFCLAVMGAVRVQAIGGQADDAAPARLLAVLRSWLDDDDERTRWIVAKTLGRAWAKTRRAEALALLHVLVGDQSRSVRVAAAASARALASAAPSGCLS